MDDECGAIVNMPPGSENSLEIYELARFAVAHHNHNQNALLEYKKVTNVKTQLVAGLLYYITLEAEEDGRNKVYEAKVWIRPWMKFKSLTEFKRRSCYIYQPAAATTADWSHCHISCPTVAYPFSDADEFLGFRRLNFRLARGRLCEKDVGGSGTDFGRSGFQVVTEESVHGGGTADI
ncbi:Cysteine proteinase inhibitor 3 [Striga hermonthica]|uniref:Cysteine proteinase inhibitor n=1 Tax=Striga hermonthica TaxID=68872 RepID=A0A9N7R005_STRHE|nr:Cysteine proteinase inhibitor 3 [Striga hermonthica]